MLLVTLRNLRAHKRRLISTFVAVVLGVAFLAGVLVQTETLNHKFLNLFDTISADVDGAVRSDRSAPSPTGDGSRVRPPIDGTTVDRVRAVPGVAVAEADWSGTAVILDHDGKAIGTMGPPQLALTWHQDPALSAFRLVDGVAPSGADQIVIDRATAERGHLKVGDRTRVLLPDPLEVTVTGIARLGRQDGMSGATVALFSAAGANAHLATPAATVSSPISQVLYAAQPGVDPSDLATRVARSAGTGTETLDRAAYRAENRDSVDDIMGFLRPTLLTFALIALLVAAFSIYNTFAILVAQRTREAALLRAIGASRSQTLRAVLVESALVGVVASLLGLVVGLGVAQGLGALLAKADLDLPGGLLLQPATLLGCGVVGTAITVLCALGPAVRASRVGPVEALRDAAIDSTGTSRGRLVAGIGAAVASVATIAASVTGHGGMAIGGLGVATAIVALVILGPVIAGPIGRLLGQPLRLRGLSGDLARQNAVRNPRRTASSASALMIGVAIVALFTVLGASIKATIDDQVNEQFGGDLIVSPSIGTIEPGLAHRLDQLPEVDRAVGTAGASITIDGDDQFVIATDVAAMTGLLDVGPANGNLAAVTGSSMAVSARTAKAHDWRVGSRVPVTFADGSQATVTVAATYRVDDLVGDYLLPTALVADRGQPITDMMVFVGFQPGTSLPAGRAAVEAVTNSMPTIEVRDRKEFAAFLGGEVDTVLLLVYGMLALSIAIALMGIANTLSLSTHERSRELGLLRAVGQTRRQTRVMVRLESVIVAVYGTVLGMVVGVTGAWVLVRADGGTGISHLAVPSGPLVAVLLVGAAAGVTAALRPAARAARQDPLAAIAGA